MAPEIRQPGKVSNWCSVAPRPHLMDGFFVEWFRGHFCDPENIEHKELRSRLWQLAPVTNLVIETISNWRPDLTEKKPAVIVRGEDWNLIRVGIDNRLMGGVSSTGERYFACLEAGSHTLFCLAGKGAEAKILGSEVYREMLQYSSWIRKELDLIRFQPVGIGRMFELEESKETYAVPVTIGYVAHEHWREIPQAPKLKRISLQTLLP